MNYDQKYLLIKYEIKYVDLRKLGPNPAIDLNHSIVNICHL